MDKPGEIIGTAIQNDPLIQQIEKAKEVLDDIITKRMLEIQNSCEHKMILTFDKDIEQKHRKKVLTSKKCEKCGISEEKPKGMPWQICEECWSPMEDDGVVQQQDYREHHYRCSSEKCSNKTFTT